MASKHILRQGTTAIILIMLIAFSSPAVPSASAFTSPISTKQIAHRQHHLQIRTSSSFPYSSTLTSTPDPSNSPKNSNEEKVQVGSSEYYKGFLNRSMDVEPVERVTGDAVLVPTLKFAGGVALFLVALVIGFLASNGLL
jgi:hypothetical protein|eukprot:scaffold13345_cov209-Alexandrium_tamarense.AAC.19